MTRGEDIRREEQTSEGRLSGRELGMRMGEDVSLEKVKGSEMNKQNTHNDLTAPSHRYMACCYRAFAPPPSPSNVSGVTLRLKYSKVEHVTHSNTYNRANNIYHALGLVLFIVRVLEYGIM